MSHHEYFWDPYSRSPKWSRTPEPTRVELDLAAGVQVPPFSVLILQVPLKGASSDAVAKGEEPRAAGTDLEILLPEATPEDIPVEAWVLLPESGSYSPDAEPQIAQLAVDGPATIDLSSVRINEGAGRFFVQPTGTGPIRITASWGESSVVAQLESRPVEARDEVLWRFEGEDGLRGVQSDLELGCERYG